MRKSLVKYENAGKLAIKMREEFLKSIRHVKSNGFTSPGIIPSRKNYAMVDYESAPEKEMAYFLEFSIAVKRFTYQPVQIPYTNLKGNPAKYTPAFLAFYNTEMEEFKNEKPTLFEVKMRRHIKKDWPNLKNMYVQAMHFCETKGWRFKIITEVELSTPYMRNAKFLTPYLKNTPGLGLIENVMDAMHELEDSATPRDIINIGATEFYRRAALVPALWYLVAKRIIKCDLSQDLTMQTPLWYIKS